MGWLGMVEDGGEREMEERRGEKREISRGAEVDVNTKNLQIKM